MAEKRLKLRKRALTFDAIYDGAADEDDSVAKGGHSLRKRARVDYTKTLVEDDDDHPDRPESRHLLSPASRGRKGKGTIGLLDDDSASFSVAGQKRRKLGASTGSGTSPGTGRRQKPARQMRREPHLRPENSSDNEILDTIEVGFSGPNTLERSEDGSSIYQTDSQSSSSSEDEDDEYDDHPDSPEFSNGADSRDAVAFLPGEVVESPAAESAATPGGALGDHSKPEVGEKAPQQEPVQPTHESNNPESPQFSTKSEDNAAETTTPITAAAEPGLEVLQHAMSAESKDSVRSTIEAVPESSSPTESTAAKKSLSVSQIQSVSLSSVASAEGPFASSGKPAQEPESEGFSASLSIAAHGGSEKGPDFELQPKPQENEADPLGAEPTAAGSISLANTDDTKDGLATHTEATKSKESGPILLPSPTIHKSDAISQLDPVVKQSTVDDETEPLQSTKSSGHESPVSRQLPEQGFQSPSRRVPRDDPPGSSDEHSRPRRMKSSRLAKLEEQEPARGALTPQAESIDQYTAYSSEIVYYPQPWEEEDIVEAPTEPEPDATRKPGNEVKVSPLSLDKIDGKTANHELRLSGEDNKLRQRDSANQSPKDVAVHETLHSASSNLGTLLAQEPWRATGEDPQDMPTPNVEDADPDSMAVVEPFGEAIPVAENGEEFGGDDVDEFEMDQADADLVNGAALSDQDGSNQASDLDEDVPSGTPTSRLTRGQQRPAQQDLEDTGLQRITVTKYPAKQYPFRKIRDPADLMERLQDFKSMPTEDLYEMVEIAAMIMHEWQTEYNEVRKSWEDEDNAARRLANDKAIGNWEKRLNLDQPLPFHFTADEAPKGPPPFVVRGARAPKPYIDDDMMERQRENDKIQALVLGFRHNNHPSRVGAQNPEEQRFDTGGTRLRERKQTQKAVEAAEDNLIVTGKRTRKPRILSDDSRNASRAGTPVEPVRGSTRARRRVAEPAEPYDDEAEREQEATRQPPRRRIRTATAKAAAAAETSGSVAAADDAPRNRRRRRDAKGKFEATREDGDAATPNTAYADDDAEFNEAEDEQMVPATKRQRGNMSKSLQTRLKPFHPISSASFYSHLSPLDVPSTATEDSRPTTSSSAASADTNGSSYSLRNRPRQNYRDTIIDDFATEPKRRTTRRAPVRKGTTNGPSTKDAETAMDHNSMSQPTPPNSQLQPIAPAPQQPLAPRANSIIAAQKAPASQAQKGTRIKLISRNPTPQPPQAPLAPQPQPHLHAIAAAPVPSTNPFGVFSANGPPLAPAPVPSHVPLLAAASSLDAGSVTPDLDLDELEAAGRILTKSEKMSLSMKRRWANGGMDAAVAKRKATLARKKQEKILKKAEAATGAPSPSDTAGQTTALDTVDRADPTSGEDGDVPPAAPDIQATPIA